MHLFLKLQEMAAERGDGLGPEWLGVLVRATAAADASIGHAAVALTIVEPAHHKGGDAGGPPRESTVVQARNHRQAIG